METGAGVDSCCISIVHSLRHRLYIHIHVYRTFASAQRECIKQHLCHPYKYINRKCRLYIACTEGELCSGANICVDIRRGVCMTSNTVVNWHVCMYILVPM